MKTIIVDSGRGIRRLDPSKSYPFSLEQLKPGRRTLDWNLEALRYHNIEQVVFVGGYHLEKMIAGYPGLKFYYHEKWKSEEIVAALKLVLHEFSEPCIICSGDTIFRQQAVDYILKGKGRLRFAGNWDAKNSRFEILLMYVHPEAVGLLKKGIEMLSQSDPSANLTDIYRSELGSNIEVIDLKEQAVSLHAPYALAQFVLGSKAQTLNRLKPLLKNAVILDQISFSVSDWSDNPEAILQQIINKFDHRQQVIVRSSTVAEDGWTNSLAGHYRSILNVCCSDRDAIISSINDVIASYGSEKNNADEVLIQPQLGDVAVSGVIFTRDINTHAPYYLINYDRTSRTDGITSGYSQSWESLIIYKNIFNGTIKEKWAKKLLDAVKEIEFLVSYDVLDIEFAIDSKDIVYIFQVRPLTACTQDESVDDSDLEQEVGNIENFLEVIEKPRPDVYGNGILLGNMPDWNPAEMIGTSPRPLALSLYQTLITDSVWARARSASGYRYMYPEPLMICLCGHPYIDIRVSLNSFLPEDLPESVAQKLIEYQCVLLKNKPHLHDKIEFSIAITCASFDIDERVGNLTEHGFSVNEVSEIKNTLITFTNAILSGKIAPIDEQIKLLNRLGRWREALNASRKKKSVSEMFCCLRRIHADTCSYGTYPFSILARYAFISLSFLKSMKKYVFGDDKVYDKLLASISTVASEIACDMSEVSNNRLSLEEFLNKYGHLRPGTYDIKSPTYAQAHEFYLSNCLLPVTDEKSKLDPKNFLKSRSKEIRELLSMNRIEVDINTFVNFLIDAISARERAKFEFTKNVNLMLETISDIGELIGLSRDDMSFIPIESLLKHALNSHSAALTNELYREFNHNKKRYALTKAIPLPDFISCIDDVKYYKIKDSRPNFITMSSASAEIYHLNGSNISSDIDLKNRIVVIKSADPGYDWIFAHNISGLITKYGGVASHMAIRAAEFKLPAAIGCGENIYRKLLNAKYVKLDCTAKKIMIY